MSVKPLKTHPAVEALLKWAAEPARPFVTIGTGRDLPDLSRRLPGKKNV